MKRLGLVVLLAVSLLVLLAGTAVGRGGGNPSSKDPFWLGSYFAGLPFDQEAFARSGTISYGDCELPEGEGGCALPVSVQTQTSCARNPIAIDRLPERVWRLRGGGLAVAYEPTAVDVGTGNRTVTVYTTELQVMSAALRDVRRRSQSSPLTLPPPVYPEVVLGELKRVTAAADRLHRVKAVAAATELTPAEVRVRLQIAELLGPKALAGVPVPKISTATLEQFRQIAFAAREIGLAKTAAKEGITVAQARSDVRQVRGLVGYC